MAMPPALVPNGLQLDLQEYSITIFVPSVSPWLAFLFHSVLDHVDAEQLAVHRHLDGDHVDAPVTIGYVVFLQVRQRQLDQLRLLGRRDRLLRRAALVAAPCANFDDDERAVLLGDDVDFADRAAPVALDDVITAPLQLSRG